MATGYHAEGLGAFLSDWDTYVAALTQLWKR